ncbi:hypothetical protein E1A91_D11G113700v1 [Gossypium mustelinum]|uniref:Secreted protein n=1 Tax=Gossypium mustelinum TaxID=34275 RepID=A0A5D2SRF2_GOSMU|nr:hypothetical protein E1A91_D11G113700v1 [Gossypium mustelinum]
MKKKQLVCSLLPLFVCAQVRSYGGWTWRCTKASWRRRTRMEVQHVRKRPWVRRRRHWLLKARVSVLGNALG